MSNRKTNKPESYLKPKPDPIANSFKSFKLLKVLLSSMVLLSMALSQGGGKVKADDAQVQEDESVKINVLKNDNFEDKSNVVIEITTEPEKGMVQVQGQKILYTPDANVVGVDKFNYKADNGLENGSAQVRVNINPVNDPPTGLSLSESNVKENAAAGIYLHSAEVEDIHPDVEIDLYQFVLDEKYPVREKKLLCVQITNF